MEENELIKKGETRKEKSWIKLLRAVIYFVSIVSLPVGISLIKTGGLSVSYADGTSAAKIKNGEIILLVSLIVLSANILWGILRWFLRSYREHWTVGRIVGKLIGGGIWRTLVIIPLVLMSLIFVAPRVSRLISDRVQNTNKTVISLAENFDKLKYVDENFSKLSIEEINNTLDGLLFNNIDFSVDASSNISHNRNPFFFTDVSAHGSTVTTLNKAKLSSAKNFVVFYTDTGDDKISDATAQELAEMLETIILNYKNNLGLEYQYQKLNNNTSKLNKIQEVLRSSNIDEKILDSAMPVYVVDPNNDGSTILATYFGRKFKEPLESIITKLADIVANDEFAKLANSTPSYPFINIVPSSTNANDLAVVAAHELGHHYIEDYSYSTYGKPGSNDRFIGETTPDWMAINVLSNQPTDNMVNMNHYNENYLRSYTDLKISEVRPDFLGYPAVAFLENYYEIVPNASTIFLDAAYRGDAFNYLYEKAGADNHKKVMVSLTEKNLTGDYDGKLINIVQPKGQLLACTDYCSKLYQINPSSSQYLYFATSEFKNVNISFNGKDGTLVSILGKNYQDEFKIINSGSTEDSLLITEEDFEKYEVIVFAVTNVNPSTGGSYQIDILSKDLEDLIETAGKYDFSSLYTELKPGCYEINTDSIFDNLLNFIDFGSNLIPVLEKLTDEDFSGVKSTYDKTSTEAKTNIIEAKEGLSSYRTTVCANYIKGSDFDSVKDRLQHAFKNDLNLYDEKDSDGRLSIFIGFDLLSRSSKVHFLAESQGEMGLVTVKIEEK